MYASLEWAVLSRIVLNATIRASTTGFGSLIAYNIGCYVRYYK